MTLSKRQLAKEMKKTREIKTYIKQCQKAFEPARLDPDGTAKPKTRIVSHPKAEHCVGPGMPLSNPEYEDEHGHRVGLTARPDHPDPLEIEVEINERFLETCGTGTLTGTVMKLAGDWSALTDVKKVTLVFLHKLSEQSYMRVPSYALPCLLENVFNLQGHGILVEIKWL